MIKIDSNSDHKVGNIPIAAPWTWDFGVKHQWTEGPSWHNSTFWAVWGRNGQQVETSMHTLEKEAVSVLWSGYLEVLYHLCWSCIWADH